MPKRPLEGYASDNLYQPRKRYSREAVLSNQGSLNYDDTYDNNHRVNRHETVAEASIPAVDEETEQRYAFPIESVPPSNGPPQNVAEYMASVRKEALARPNIICSHEPLHREQSSITIDGQDNNSVDEHVEETGYKMETTGSPWHASIVENFANSRKQFLANQGSISEKTLCEELPHTLSKWRVFMFSADHPPRASLIASLELPLVLRLLGYSQKWLSAKISQEFAAWIYCLLVRLPDVFTADELSVVRELAKKAKLILSNPRQELDSTTSCILQVIVSVVGGVYGQTDLICDTRTT
jgi:survival of motor neuron protein-interacting protein 1